MTVTVAAFRRRYARVTLAPVSEGDTTTQPGFADQLRDAIREAGMSVRGLARVLAGDQATPQQVESERRQLSKYLAGQHVPSALSAHELEQALGVEAGTFPTAEDQPRPRHLADQVAEIGELVHEVRDLITDRYPEAAAAADGQADPRVARRLRELEATVDRQGEALTTALTAVAERLERIEHLLAPPASTPMNRRRRSR